MKISGVSVINLLGDPTDTSVEPAVGITCASLTVAGTDLAVSLGAKQDELDSTSALNVNSLTVGNGITANSILAPSGSGLVLGNAAATGITVASTGGVGILKNDPVSELDVFGTVTCLGLTVGGTDLSASLDAKQDELSSLAGTGISLLNGPAELRRVFGVDGIFCDSPLNLNDPTDPTNFQLRISGSELQSQITAGLAAKLDASEITKYYTTLETNTLLDFKATSSEVYSKSQANGLLDAKQNVISDAAPIAISSVQDLQNELDLRPRAIVDADGLSTKQDTLDSNSIVTVASLTSVGDINCAGVNADTLTVQKSGGANLIVQALDTGRANLRLLSTEGTEFQFLTSSETPRSDHSNTYRTSNKNSSLSIRWPCDL